MGQAITWPCGLGGVLEFYGFGFTVELGVYSLSTIGDRVGFNALF